MSSIVIPDTVFKLKGRWEERCSEICRILLNYVDGITGIRGKVKYGIYFMSSIETPEDEKIREKQEQRHQEEEKAYGVEGEANEEKYEEITLTLVLNKVCGGKYKHPNEFWDQLGQMFRNCIISYPDESSSYRKMADKLRLLSYHLYVDWYSLFTNKEKDTQRRIIEAERVMFFEQRNEMRRKRREEWKVETPDEKEDEKKKDENKEGEEKKDDKDVQDEKKPDEKTPEDNANTTQQEGVQSQNPAQPKDGTNNDVSMSQSNPAPVQSTHDNVSMANQARDNTFTTENQQMPQNMGGIQNPGNINPMNQNDHQNNQFMMQGQNMQPNSQGGPIQGQNPGNRLPSLSSLPTINNAMNTQPNMYGPNGIRIPSMFGNGMQMNMGFQGNNPFQGGRMIPPNFNSNMMMNNGNMGMLNPAMHSQMLQQNMIKQMQMKGMVPPFNPNMGGFPPGMMNMAMAGQMQNPMMARMGMNPQMGMFPPGHPMAMRQNMMNPHFTRNMNNNENQNENYVPGGIEENAINAIKNIEFKAHDENDLLQIDYDIENKSGDISPGEYNLVWLLMEGETERNFQESALLSQEELNIIISRTLQFDQLYLVKWTNLSYVDATWEPYSLIQQYDELIEGFEMRNKRIDTEQRNKLQKSTEITKKLVEYLGISEKKRKNMDEDDIDNHLKLFKFRKNLFQEKPNYTLYEKEKGKAPVYKKGQKLKDYQVNG